MASSASSSCSNSCSSSRSYAYDVFLSFRGEDTRLRFVDHLYTALGDKPIITFKDDKRLLPGESIGPSLFTAIEESQIALVVFSENYANSSWCLEELAYIMKCEVERGLIIMPIFYNVEPTEVRNQKGKFGEAFARHEKENTTKVESWREALADASNVVGFHYNNRPESEFIKEIVDKILDRLSLSSYVDEEFVGMTTRVQDLKSQLEISSNGVHMVGIWGVGGGGKTSLATSVHMEISHHFQGHCIVENVREKSSKDGLEKLQENILSAILKTEVKVPSVVEGKRKMKSMLSRRKVLVVLDDIDKLEQLEALAGSYSWFGNGSRIIITTRNEHVLNAHKVDKVCPLRLLSDKEAMKLFNKHACNEKKTIKDYEGLSLRVVSYAAGLPLALKVLGSFLYDKDEKEWMSALDRLKDIPEMEIVEKLKISYDGLTTLEKELFLDIACFFRGKDKNDAMEIFEACGFHPEIGIKVLRQKSLITIAENGGFDMHDLVQEMAHYIVRGVQPNDPQYHSRVWKQEEFSNMCLTNAIKENDTIEAIGLCYIDRNASRFCKNVSNMKKLRWLHVIFLYEDLDYGPDFLSTELRYISWRRYPWISFPDSFQPMKLVVLKLSLSFQEVLWKGYKRLPHLKVLQLKSMKYLVSTPDFDGLPHLQKLTLDDCEALKEIHPSLGNHTSLEHISVSFCTHLSKFPTIVHMGKLHTLEIVKCLKILEFPEIQGNMKSLVNLSLAESAIEVLPSSIGERCTNLTSLNLKKCGHLKSVEFNMNALKCLKEFSYNPVFYNSTPKTQLLSSNTRLLSSKMRFHRFPRKLQKPESYNCILQQNYPNRHERGIMKEARCNFYREIPPAHKERHLPLEKVENVLPTFHQFPRSLRKLNLYDCFIEDGKILSGIVELFNLEELDLSLNNFSRLDFSLLQLTRLKILNVDACVELVELPELPSSVAILKADYCNSLTAIGDSLANCRCLCKVSLEYGGILNDGTRVLESMLKGNIESGAMLLRLQGGFDIAKGFTPALHLGNECRLQLPEKWRTEFCGFLMCAVGKGDLYAEHDSVKITVEQVMSGSMDNQHDVFWKESDDDAVTWVGYISFLRLRDAPWWDQTYSQLSFHIKDCFIEGTNGFGVRLVGKKRESGSGLEDSSPFSISTSDLKIKIDHVSAYGLIKINIPSLRVYNND